LNCPPHASDGARTGRETTLSNRVLRASLLGSVVGGAINLAYAMIASHTLSGRTPSCTSPPWDCWGAGRSLTADLRNRRWAGLLHFAMAILMALVLYDQRLRAYP
jgi:hypothetical protein